MWTHEPSGELCKCRADGLALSLPPGLLVDLKKTRHQTLRQFFRDATEYGYHAQLAMYQDAVHAATGERVPAKLLVAQSLAPWDRFVVNMPDEVLQVGRSVYEDCIAQVQRARESGVWPGLAPDGPVDFELPAYAMPTDDDPTGLGLDWGTDEGSDSDE